jgi:hypothetical protein
VIFSRAADGREPQVLARLCVVEKARLFDAFSQRRSPNINPKGLVVVVDLCPKEGVHTPGPFFIFGDETQG